MTEPTFGISFLRDDNEPRPAVTADMSVVGLFGPMADAQDGIPINRAITFNSDDTSVLNALGSNDVADAVRGINDQLADFQRAARVVLVRTPASTSADPATKINENIGSAVGTQAEGSGMYGLLKAGPALGVIPRLIACPGLTGHQTAVNEANLICASLPGVLAKLMAVAAVDGPANSLQGFTNWRETMQSERLIPIETAVKAGNADGTTSVRPASGRILGVAVRRDFEKGGFPFHSWANQPVQGIAGPNRPIDYSLTDGATEGQEILAMNGGVIVRGEMGVDTAISDSGFVFIGTDTCSADTLWQFYNQVRGRDFIHLMFLRTLRYYLGRFNITGHAIQSVLNTMSFALRDLKADEHILGYTVGFTKDKNSPENIRKGRFCVRFAAEEPPVFRHLTIQSARYREALNAMLDDLLTQLELAA
ncbi:hypothetical protein BJ122_102271 [Rhodopseudomonas faecalis]|uniref:Phage tail protein n=1 Tax=Rhodopseudomonas faecalis TaxID=99655 RepID=A0A318TT75_9BRAD|nr:phage tail protein [Rhodopseudomonas faecalis]PYF05045.1 hypothetical protein BJ122_102271 [Rhodopseudomonas faecalis]